MRNSLVIAIGMTIAALSSTTAFAQDKQDKQGDKKPQPQQRQGDQRNQSPQRRPPQNPPAQSPPNRVRTRPSQNPPPTSRPAQPPIDRRSQNPPSRPTNDRSGNWSPPSQSNWQPRPGQIVIPANRNWRPNTGHSYNSSVYISIDFWAPTSFGYGGNNNYQWDPSVWHYSVEDSLMELVYRSERMSNALRDAFERQMTQSGMRSSRRGQAAWDRVQRMDESLERLRSETGSVSEAEMQGSALEALSLAQQVSNSLNNDPDMMAMVRYQWGDLQFELNEMARYYDEPAIR